MTTVDREKQCIRKWRTKAPWIYRAAIASKWVDICAIGASSVSQDAGNMDTRELADRFLQSVDALVGNQKGKWSFVYLKTAHGTETRNGFLDACSELFVLFIGQPKPVVYGAVCDALRRRGDHWAVQRYGGMVLLNLVSDAYGQVDELIDIVAPVFDVSNGEIPAFLVEQVGLEAVLRKIEERKKTAKDPEILSRLGGLAYQAQVYHNRKTRKIGWHEGA